MVGAGSRGDEAIDDVPGPLRRRSFARPELSPALGALAYEGAWPVSAGAGRLWRSGHGLAPGEAVLSGVAVAVVGVGAAVQSVVAGAGTKRVAAGPAGE